MHRETAPADIDLSHGAFDPTDVYGTEHVVRWHGDGREVGLVAPHPNSVERVWTDEGDDNLVEQPEFIARAQLLPRSTGRRSRRLSLRFVWSSRAALEPGPIIAILADQRGSSRDLLSGDKQPAQRSAPDMHVWREQNSSVR
jgi:hypothetical protein